MALPEKPETRKEKYLANIAGQNVPLPDHPITREEAYLDEIAKNGGGGGGGGVASVNGKTGVVNLDAEDVGALPDDTPIPAATSDLNNDSGFITKAVNDLVNYYLKTETYSKTEVDSIVTAIKNSRFEVVSTLPVSDIHTNVIYLVPSSDPQTSNVKDEYINLDGTSSGWELIGSTSVDLTGYVTTSDLNTALAAYTTTLDLTTLLAAKADKSTVDGILNGTQIDSFGDVETALAGKADTTDIPDITGKADKVANATNGNFAALDANGNLADSGISPSDLGSGHTIINGDGQTMPQRGKMQFKRFSVEDDSTNDVTIIQPKDYRIFAVHYSENNSDPDSCDYPYGYDNYGWTPFSMNLSTGVPNYGSWDPSGDNADLVKFIFPRSCMLKYDGTVDYYLDENDETKKEDGTASDVADTSYGGNAMMEWGQDGKKLYWKILPDANNKGWTFIVADKAVNRYGNPDPDMRPWNHYDCNGNVAAHWYTAKYFGSNINSKIRSISGQSNYTEHTDEDETTKCKANNTDSNVIWDKEVYADRIFIVLMCVLLCKSLNTQVKFGYGRIQAASDSPIKPGTMNGKGMFYGVSDKTSGVKVFGMENFWGNLWRRIRGLINVSGTVKVKMTHSTQDGTTVSDYNQTGSGYLTVGSIGNASGYMYASAMNINKYSLTPKTSNGSDNTYYTDGASSNTTQTSIALTGGGWQHGFWAGAFCFGLGSTASSAPNNGGATLSCKPLA